MGSVIPAAIGAVGSIAGGAIGAGAAGSAANSQQQAAQQATQAQLQMYGNTAKNLLPYMQSGLVGQDALMRAIPTLIKPFLPTMDQLSKTPGYQFAKQQGQLATQNGFAAQGLGTSGAALKGAANYAEGLASTTYQQQFNNDLATKSQEYNMLAGPGSQGLSAALGLAGVGSNTSQQIGNNLIGAGNAAAGGAIGSANAISGAFNGVSNNAMFASLYGGGFGGGGSGSGGGFPGGQFGAPINLGFERSG